MLAIFSILSGIFLLFLAYLILKANPKKAKNRFMALMLVTEALRCFTSMLFWVYAWPEEMLNVLRPGRIVYYTMSLQLFFLYMAAATFYSEREWAKKISGFFQFHGLYLLPLFCLTSSVFYLESSCSFLLTSSSRPILKRQKIDSWP